MLAQSATRRAKQKYLTKAELDEAVNRLYTSIPARPKVSSHQSFSSFATMQYPVSMLCMPCTWLALDLMRVRMFTVCALSEWLVCRLYVLRACA